MTMMIIKKTAIFFTLMISGLFLVSCSGSAEKKETPKVANTTVTNTAIAPQSNTQTVTNTAVTKEDNDADDMRRTNSNVSTVNNSSKKDSDDKSKSNSNVKSKDKDDLNKKNDADDRGKKRDSDGDEDDN